MMFLVCAILILCLCICLMRAILGPTVFDRILAVNASGTLTVLFIAVYGFMIERPEFLDIALVYSLINFIGTVAILKYFKDSDSEKIDERHQEANS